MKYPPRPLSRFAAVPSAIFGRNLHLHIHRKRLRSTIDLQLLSLHQLMNRFFRNPPVLNNFCVAPCYFQIPSSKQAPPSRFTRAKAVLLSTFRMNTCKSVSKHTTLTTFRMNTHAKQGEGVLPPNTPLLTNGASSLRSPPRTAIRYLWPVCVMRARMSRRLSATVAPRYSARSAAVHLPIVALMAAAHLSMPSALG